MHSYCYIPVRCVLVLGLWLWCSTPHSTIFQLFRGSPFYWWVEETGVPGENHRPAASHWQTFHIMLYGVHLAWVFSELCVSNTNTVVSVTYIQFSFIKQGNYPKYHIQKGLKISNEVFISCKSNDRQHKDQKNKNKMRDNDLQYTTPKTKGWATRTPLKSGDELGCCRRINSSCSNSDIPVVLLLNDTKKPYQWVVPLTWHIYSRQYNGNPIPYTLSSSLNILYKFQNYDSVFFLTTTLLNQLYVKVGILLTRG